ncbi:MFS transporter [Methanosphaerula palustris]|uniref:Major facilitator superfamily MFS_1 n=1 Tax=Methanosphaerula palustris (strain ATCC BAA-1556 / DSM 19958 / E1-9c) TaxID=521011 RepID=B8GF78_METPE|nr:MFS transporter [Methanosphaerula palustris]ACL17884.1 major facilitator superfamily MFS_1 [Methanosphaerula palustris E1-9c]
MVITPFKPTKFQPTRWTLLFLLLSAMMILMGGAAIAPALPLISAAFPDTPDSLISLIVTLPSLAIAISGIFIGALSDKIGKMKILVASVAIFTIAGCSGYFLTSIHALLLSRIILGIGIAGITCTTSSLIPCYYEGPTRAKVLGYQAAAMGFGVLILEMSGGLLAGISWHAAFLIYLIGVVILAGVLLSMKEPVLPKIEKNTVEANEEFPLSLLLLTYITLFMGSMLFYLMPTKFPYFIANLDAARILGENTALISGLFLGIMGCAASIIGIFYGRLVWRFNQYTILAIIFICFGIGYCSLGLATSLPVVAFSVICIGLGNGILMPTILTWIATITPKQFLGRASGGFSVALNIGQFASSLVVVPVIAIAATTSTMFLAFGSLAFVIALPYLLAMMKERHTLPQGVVRKMESDL